MTFYIVENNLREYLGHFFNISVGIKQAFESFALESKFLVHQDADNEILKTLDADAIFPDTSWAGDRDENPLSSMHYYGNRFANALARTIEPCQDDWIVLTTAFQDQFLGTAKYLNTLPRDRRPRIICYVHWSTWENRAARVLAWKEACTSLAEAAGTGRFIFAGATEKLMTDFTNMSGYSSVLWPMPLNYGFRESRQTKQKSNSIRVTSLGRSLIRKGSQHLPRVTLRTKIRRPLTRFSMQVSNNMSNLRRLRFFPGVEIIDGGNDFSAHISAVQKASIMLLPYRRKDYAYRTSGLMAEAAAHGCVVVVPGQTWLSDQIDLDRASGIAFREQTVEDITAALIRAIDNFDKLSLKAFNASKYWWKNQSSQAFVKKIVEYI